MENNSKRSENENGHTFAINDEAKTPLKQNDSEVRTRISGLLYSIEDTPPWYLCIFLGIQHTILAESSIFGAPILLAPYLCASGDIVGIGELISTILVVSGIVTLLQTVIGSRLPIIQGVSVAFIASVIVILGQDKWTCEYTAARNKYGADVNYTHIGLPELGSEGHRDIWMKRIREVQGAIMVAGTVEFLIGFSGAMGFILRFIGPITIAPTITMIGFSLFQVAARFGSKQWWIALLTVFLVVVFSQYMKNVKIPVPSINKKGCHITFLPLFSLFPVLFATAITWGLCAIMTASNVFPNDDTKWGYSARTDVRIAVIDQAPWFRFPYPGQWGMPTVSVASVVGLLAAIIASMVESIGDYYACARLSGAPPIPIHAVNRGLATEGIGVLLAGAWGTGTGTTSYSQNIGAIGITKVGCRRVIQVAAVIFLISGCIGKFGAVMATIPEPIFGGLFIVGFGMVTAAGLSNLQHVNLNSQRNMFVIGVAMFSGLCIPTWMASEDGKQAIQTGNDTVNQIFSVLLGSHMLVGGVVGFFLDNTIPGTPEDRGLLSWTINTSTIISKKSSQETYAIPLIQGILDRVPLFRFMPICPSFKSGNERSHDNSDITYDV